MKINFFIIKILFIWLSIMIIMINTKKILSNSIFRQQRSSSSSSSSSSLSLNNLNNEKLSPTKQLSSSLLSVKPLSYKPFATLMPTATLIPYIPHQNIYPIHTPYRLSLINQQQQQISLLASPIITTIRWNTLNDPIALATATMPIYTQQLFPSTTVSNNQKLFQRRIDTNNNNNCKTNLQQNIPISSTTEINRPLSTSSETYPVYVLPPKDFQPIIYQQPSSLASFFTPLPLIYHHQQQLQQKHQQNKFDNIPQKILHDLNGLNNDDIKKSSAMTSEQIDKNKITLIPVNEANFDNLPLLEASSINEQVKNDANDTNNIKYHSFNNQQQIAAINPYSYIVNNNNNNNNDDDIKTKNNNRRYKTKLPVGLTSFFLGGTRGVSGRHWNLPKNLQKKLEFMPNLIINDNQYYPDSDNHDLSSLSSTISTEITDDKLLYPEKEDDYNNDKSKTTKNHFNINNIFDGVEDLVAEESKNLFNDNNSNNKNKDMIFFTI